MKKKMFGIILVLLVLCVSGCGNNKKKDKQDSLKPTVEELIGYLEDGYNKQDINLIFKAMPDFYANYIRAQYGDSFYMIFDGMKLEYGDDYKVSYNITGQTKKDDEWLEENNRYLINVIPKSIEADECYEIEGTQTIKGSRKEETNDIIELWYCNFDGTWRLLIG